MLRFLALVLPLLVMVLALFVLGLELLGIRPPGGAGWAPVARVSVGGWILESVGLTALYLLARGRAPSWWLDGLVAAWIAWIFRAPLLVLALASFGIGPLAPWWRLALGWWLVYSICGLLLAVVARTLALPD